MDKLTIKQINTGNVEARELELEGWVRTHRQSKRVSFIELSDGSSVKGLQLVIDPSLTSYAQVAAQISTGAAIWVRGKLVESPGQGQRFEMQVSDLRLVGESDPESYPLQKKGHTLEFLREVLHLRPRSNTFGAVFRIRSVAAMGIHSYFQERGYVYVTTPIISSSDCEGAGEMFRVTTLDLLNLPLVDGKIDYSHDFFKQETSLTVSGQLEAEIFATAISKAYTFGPTFRAENSNTSRHLSEFWMIEPEVAFCDLQGDMRLAEDFLKYVIKYVLDRCGEDLDFLHTREDAPQGLRQVLESVANSSYAVLDYSEAIRVLENSGESFEFPVHWGADLQSEHERYLTEKYVKGPLFVINYPKEIKAFYMRMNEDQKTVAAMDVLVPQLGEIIGGSQREERHDVLLSRIEESGLDPKPYWWYLDLRKYGSVPHAGFGLGFERFLMYLTGMHNIRDVIPVPRHPGFAEF